MKLNSEMRSRSSELRQACQITFIISKKITSSLTTFFNSEQSSIGYFGFTCLSVGVHVTEIPILLYGGERTLFICFKQ